MSHQSYHSSKRSSIASVFSRKSSAVGKASENGVKTICFICKERVCPYKCTCEKFFCSGSCFKQHKEFCTEAVKISKAESGMESRRNKYLMSNHSESLSDTNRLSIITDEIQSLLMNSLVIKDKLVDPAFFALLCEIIESENPEKRFIDAYAEDKNGFRNFSSEILEIIKLKSPVDQVRLD